ncbi:DNA gyrase inhibitor YacG [Natronospira bacteriovora]|uniref:DNA gyrase inhibitor YacG n=1 Tax=Natronospira bacteriovora TaxID=3069753 RepID=A0ABU0W933_9GAMM|nr:DNA gyrase inhibitor YacG [Natronospira sp. AB-CW4]MDQ2069495.1 DNA gyrase inhibitor YacG [Natronospira sp. AB-CW4]
MPERPAPEVNCPHCGKKTPFSPDNRWRPFCSERCRMVDLGEWFNEEKRIPEDSPDWPGDES